MKGRARYNRNQLHGCTIQGRRAIEDKHRIWAYNTMTNTLPTCDSASDSRVGLAEDAAVVAGGVAALAAAAAAAVVPLVVRPPAGAF